MAIRPVFIPSYEEKTLIKEIPIEFVWSPGMAISQKQKSIQSLHKSIEKQGIYPILEVSSKSLLLLGKQLSAFNLKIKTNSYGIIPVEAAFQGSKVFENNKQFSEFYNQEGWEIKKDKRLKEAGELKYFKFEGTIWELEPKTAFYDWLYLHGLLENKDIASHLPEYKGFTDIEFNPKKSINCQAKTCALYVTLCHRNLLDSCLKNKENFLNTLLEGQKPIRNSNIDYELPFNLH